MDFALDFRLFLMCSINVLFKVMVLVLNFTNAVLSKMTFGSILYIRMVRYLVPQRIHRVNPLDLKI
jgi:hypothetical protein